MHHTPLVIENPSGPTASGERLAARYIGPVRRSPLFRLLSYGLRSQVVLVKESRSPTGALEGEHPETRTRSHAVDAMIICFGGNQVYDPTFSRR